MRLLNLKAKNLFSLGEVTLSLQERGLTLVTGFSRDEGSSNGAGKSSLANKAVLWTLYGQTAGGIRADNVLNRHGKRKGKGQVQFIGMDGAAYEVIRERPAKLTLLRDDKDVSAKKAVDTQKSVDAALGMNFGTFIQTAFFGQGRAMSYASLTPKEQKSLLEEILPMEDIDRWAKYADAKLKEVKTEVDSVEREVLRVETQNASAKTQLANAERQATDWKENQNLRIYEQTLEIHKRDDALEHSLKTIKATRAQYREVTAESLEECIKEIAAKQVKLQDEMDEAWRMHFKAAESIKQWEARRTSLIKDKKDLNTATSCPTCLRPYDEDTVHSVKDRMNANLKLVAEAEVNIVQANSAAQHYAQLRENAKREHMNLDTEIDNLRHQYQQVTNLDQSEEDCRRQHAEAVELRRNNIEIIKNEENPHLGYIRTAEEQMEKLEAEWLRVQKALGTVNSELEHLTYWRDVYAKELKLKLFETCCDFLDSRTAEHLKGLRNEQIHAEFSTIKRLASGASKDEFSVHVWSETGGVGFESLSGGEQQMASFAIGLALADLAAGRIEGSSEFLILDEPFSQLDDRNSESIVEYMTGEFGRGKDTILLISNEDVLKGLIPNRIEVEKHHGITSITSGG